MRVEFSGDALKVHAEEVVFGHYSYDLVEETPVGSRQ